VIIDSVVCWTWGEQRCEILKISWKLWNVRSRTPVQFRFHCWIYRKQSRQSYYGWVIREISIPTQPNTVLISFIPVGGASILFWRELYYRPRSVFTLASTLHNAIWVILRASCPFQRQQGHNNQNITHRNDHFIVLYLSQHSNMQMSSLKVRILTINQKLVILHKFDRLFAFPPLVHRCHCGDPPSRQVKNYELKAHQKWILLLKFTFWVIYTVKIVLATNMITISGYSEQLGMGRLWRVFQQRKLLKWKINKIQMYTNFAKFGSWIYKFYIINENEFVYSTTEGIFLKWLTKLFHGPLGILCFRPETIHKFISMKISSWLNLCEIVTGCPLLALLFKVPSL
jgi:hypothetical protein